MPAEHSRGSASTSTRRWPVRRLRPDQQQMVEIARALSIDARVLILDEPTSSLTDDEVESLFAVVRRLRADGVAVIFVSHRLSEIFELADRITVLRDGRTVGGGPAAEFDRPRLIELMVGRELDEAFDQSDHEPPDAGPVLQVRGLSLPGVLDSIDLEVAPGEIVGLAGLVGAGRSELLEAIFGLHKAQGTIAVAGPHGRVPQRRSRRSGTASPSSPPTGSARGSSCR